MFNALSSSELKRRLKAEKKAKEKAEKDKTDELKPKGASSKDTLEEEISPNVISYGGPRLQEFRNISFVFYF